MKKVHIKIHGHVQGVFFRAASREKAYELGLFGWTSNHEDGTVRIAAEGEIKDLMQFVNWCRRGPLPAKVHKVEFEFCHELENFDDFEIRQ